MSSSPQGPSGDPAGPHMIVCGDDALAHRLAAELHEVHRTQVTVVVPGAETARLRAIGPARASALLGRVAAAVGRAPLPRQGASDGAPDTGVRVMEAPDLADDWPRRSWTPPPPCCPTPTPWPPHLRPPLSRHPKSGAGRRAAAARGRAHPARPRRGGRPGSRLLHRPTAVAPSARQPQGAARLAVLPPTALVRRRDGDRRSRARPRLVAVHRDDLPHAAYLTVLDVLAIDDPATDAPTARKVLQLPTVVGDVTHERVLEAAKIRRAHALLAR